MSTQLEKTFTILIDNYDSFTWNIYEYLGSLGAQVKVYRNDQVTLSELQSLPIKNIVLSPGPGSPKSNCGISMEVLSYYQGKLPILGICLGMQCMYEYYGGEVKPIHQIVHGKTSSLYHDGSGLYLNLPQSIEVTRYHSLAGMKTTLSKELLITSGTKDGIIQGIRHVKYCMEGVQFHPESVLSQYGKQMLKNFLNWEHGTWEENSINIPKESILLFNNKEDQQDEKENIENNNTETSKETSTSSILLKIVNKRRLDILQTSSLPGQSIDNLKQLIKLNCAPPVKDFYNHLKQNITQLAVLAEVKRASPSKGDIAKDINAVEQCLNYAKNGAATISVLTEPTWFKGSLLDLSQCRQSLNQMINRPCLLRKDFIVEDYQVYESRLNGADTLLLIVAILSKKMLIQLLNLARSLGMEPLVEVNNEDEMKIALDVGAKIIGVNNRNLHTFNVDLNTTKKLAKLIKQDTILIALSGISKKEDLDLYQGLNLKGVLVGEALMKCNNVQQLIEELSGKEKTIEQNVIVNQQNQPKVKICGILSEEAGLTAAKNGADFIGFIFVPGSKRQIDIEKAKSIIDKIRQNRKYNESNKNNNDELLKSNNTWYEYSNYLVELNKNNIVGVFQNQSLEEILSIANYLKLDFIQLHGNEANEFSNYLPYPVIKCFQIDEQFNLYQSILATNLHHLPLLDAKLDKNSGGLGIKFDWNLIKKLDKENKDNSNKINIILAGGLNPDNVIEAIQQVKPFAVDVSSGVETDGKKDLNKIADFIKKVKSVEY
ncbi:anthranilate synthase component 2 [Neoconidiobolus thromboides FSU 785]|nr:anthranilate synthase component 2 [Neoconidiobolus thromboides FSU 785]